jgi:two-component system, chemotaxis family, chemotaxis protein CheY
MAYIIIADPDQSIRKLLENIVRLLGWTCDMAASGGEAWQLIERAQSDLVIAEVELSKMSGIELACTMRHYPYLCHIPVLLMSSLHQKDDALAAGCAAFIAKPFYVEKLLQLLPSLVPGGLTKSGGALECAPTRGDT